MKFCSALKILALIPLVFLQACFPFIPHINHSTSDAGYALPSFSESPWLSLSNGLDIYGWHDCYAYVLRGEKCDGLTLVALPTGQKPDWKKLWSYVARSGMLDVSGHFEKPLSAHRDTSYRLLGIVNQRHEISLIRPALDSDDRKRFGYPFEYAVLRHVDIWHNNSTCHAYSIPRFVVFDDQHIWIFAEEDPTCKPNPDNQFVPNDLMKFNTATKDSALLQKPMQLFYLDFASEFKSDFREPRLVTRDSKLAALTPGARVALEEITLPLGKFQIDTNTSQRDIVNPARPTQLCHYSSTEFFLTAFDSDSLDRIRNCQPYTDAAMDTIRKRNAN